MFIKNGLFGVLCFRGSFFSSSSFINIDTKVSIFYTIKDLVFSLSLSNTLSLFQPSFASNSSSPFCFLNIMIFSIVIPFSMSLSQTHTLLTTHSLPLSLSLALVHFVPFPLYFLVFLVLTVSPSQYIHSSRRYCQRRPLLRIDTDSLTSLLLKSRVPIF